METSSDIRDRLKKPYPGLRPFTRAEAEIFFGRDEQVVAMLARLEEERFLAVVGGSGSGKSSLVRAGLLPALQEGYLLSAGSDWRFVIMKPGNSPFRNLAAAVREGLGEGSASASDVAFTDAILRSSRNGFLEALRDAGGAPTADSPVLLLVDQFEELFRFRRPGISEGQSEDRPAHERRNEAAKFVNLLLATARQSEVPVYVLLTMRSDFIGDCEAIDELPEAISTSQFLVPRLKREEIKDAIEKPLVHFQASALPRLVNRILNETGNEPDNLPLMQHALMQVWFAACERTAKAGEQEVRLGREDYEGTGGFHDALSRHADQALESLSPARQQIARRLFVALSERRSKGQTVRRDATVREIAALAGVEEGGLNELREVVHAFREEGERNFIVSSPPGELTPDTVLDISHEALLRQWETLGRWIDEEAEAAADYAWLVDNAEKKGSKDSFDPLRSLDLRRAEQWMENHNPNEAWARRYGGNFAEAIRYFEKSQEAEREAVKAKASWRRRIAGTVIVVLCALIAFTIWAVVEGKLAETAQRRAESTALELKKQQARTGAAQKRVHEALARSFVRTIGQSGKAEYTEVEIDALWDIAQLENDNEPVSTGYLKLALTEPHYTTQFLNRQEEALQALVGLDDNIRKQLLKIAMLSLTKDTEGQEFLAAASSAARLVGSDSKSAAVVAAAILSRVQIETDSVALSSLGRALGSLVEKLTAEAAASVAAAIPASMEKTTDPDALSSLGRALGSLGKKVPPDDAASIAAAIVASMEKPETDSNALSTLGRALGSLGEKLPPEAAASGAAALAARMEKPDTDPNALSSLGFALGSLGKKLPPEAAASGAAALVARMKDVTSGNALTALGSALGSLAGKLSAEDAAKGAANILAIMERPETDSRELYHLAGALGSLGEKLSAEDADKGASAILARMKRRAPSYESYDFGRALGSLGQKLPPEAAAKGAVAILASMERVNPNLFIELGRALGSVAENLSAADAANLAAAIVATILKPDISIRVRPILGRALAPALRSLGERLSAEDAAKQASAILESMEKASGNVFDDLVRALVYLGQKLSAEAAANLAGATVAIMEKPETDSRALDQLGRALGSLGEKLPPEAASRGAATIVASMQKPETDSRALSSLGDALGSLGEKLPPDYAASGATAIVARMEKMDTDTLALSSLGDALGSLGEKLPPEHAASGAAALVARMEDVTSSNALTDLGRALGSLGEKLPPEHAASGAAALVARMEDVTSSNALTDLGRALGSLTGKLSAEDAASGAAALVARMERETESDVMYDLGRALAGLGAVSTRFVLSRYLPTLHEYRATNAKYLSGTLQKLTMMLQSHQHVVELLKDPFCIGAAREVVLKELENRLNNDPVRAGKPKLDFKNNVWNFVAMADELGLDVNTPPVRPTLPEHLKRAPAHPETDPQANTPE